MLYSDFSLTVIALGWALSISSKGQLLKVTLLFLKGATKKFPYAYARKLIRFSLVDNKNFISTSCFLCNGLRIVRRFQSTSLQSLKTLFHFIIMLNE